MVSPSLVRALQISLCILREMTPFCYFFPCYTSPATRSGGRGASKSTTQGGIFDLNMYVTFDCAGIVAF